MAGSSNATAAICWPVDRLSLFPSRQTPTPRSRGSGNGKFGSDAATSGRGGSPRPPLSLDELSACPRSAPCRAPRRRSPSRMHPHSHRCATAPSPSFFLLMIPSRSAPTLSLPFCAKLLASVHEIDPPGLQISCQLPPCFRPRAFGACGRAERPQIACSGGKPSRPHGADPGARRSSARSGGNSQRLGLWPAFQTARSPRLFPSHTVRDRG